MQRHGHQLLERNYTLRSGEIDIITLDGDVLVFTEVRLRRNTSHGSGAASITATKRSRIIQTARYFLTQHPRYSQRGCRFDVISIDATNRLEWIQRAFDASGAI